jgi:hypothetical protein
MKTVRATSTLKYQGKWRIPGTTSDTFDMDETDIESFALHVQVLGEPRRVKESTILPESIPHWKKLTLAGILTIGELMAVDDLTTLRGIGPKTAAQIRDALAKLEK